MHLKSVWSLLLSCLMSSGKEIIIHRKYPTLLLCKLAILWSKYLLENNILCFRWLVQARSFKMYDDCDHHHDNDNNNDNNVNIIIFCLHYSTFAWLKRGIEFKLGTVPKKILITNFMMYFINVLHLTPGELCQTNFRLLRVRHKFCNSSSYYYKNVRLWKYTKELFRL